MDKAGIQKEELLASFLTEINNIYHAVRMHLYYIFIETRIPTQ